MIVLYCDEPDNNTRSQAFCSILLKAKKNCPVTSSYKVNVKENEYTALTSEEPKNMINNYLLPSSTNIGILRTKLTGGDSFIPFVKAVMAAPNWILTLVSNN